MSAGVAQAYLSFKAFGFGPQPRAHSLDEHFLRIVDDLMSLLWHFAPFRHNAVHARQYFPYDSTHLRDLLTLMDVTAQAIPSTDVPTTPPRRLNQGHESDVSID